MLRFLKTKGGWLDFWDLVYFLSSLWTSIIAFMGTPLSFLLLDWNHLGYSKRLGEKIAVGCGVVFETYSKPIGAGLDIEAY